MTNYLFAIVAAAVFVSVICALAPEGDGIGKYIGFAGALVVVLLALSPLSAGAQAWAEDALSMWEVSEEATAAPGADRYAEMFAYQIAATTAELYELPLREITVSVIATEDTGEAFTPNAVTVVLQRNSQADTKAASDTLSRLFSCPVQVTVSSEGGGENLNDR